VAEREKVIVKINRKELGLVRKVIYHNSQNFKAKGNLSPSAQNRKIYIRLSSISAKQVYRCEGGTS
jgi:hypothetical protein